ncbi:hypothetical protein B0J13DRAFT_249061 [Dactylonectria estremocensis]|uniref:Uncharacterized protein n=1 Tax=Dactylonectria estremocensis TaxID=1079267 RepID=A0A9P9J5G7_9HYPO|nr:hypothetical protein B0J13DRAFT_249061 [Dactylonectria estremocensis]
MDFLSVWANRLRDEQKGMRQLREDLSTGSTNPAQDELPAEIEHNDHSARGASRQREELSADTESGPDRQGRFPSLWTDAHPVITSPIRSPARASKSETTFERRPRDKTREHHWTSRDTSSSLKTNTRLRLPPPQPNEDELQPTKMMLQPETRPISQDQLAAEVKGIYAGLMMVETSCFEVDNLSNPDAMKLNDEHWRALIALHRALSGQRLSHILPGPFSKWIDLRNAQSSFPGASKLTSEQWRAILTFLAIHKSPPARRFSGRLKDYSIKAKVGEHEVDALPDTGAKHNFISQRFVEKAGLIPCNTVPQAIQLPSGRKVISPGIVKVPFVFHGETKKYMLDCRILSSGTRNLVLSNSFLRFTKTLTKFKNRIQERPRTLKTCYRVNLLGNEEQRLWGMLNGSHVLALPDTGSDISLVSAQWAKANNLEVDYSPEHHLELEQGDGSKFFTIGCVHNAKWTFGDSKQQTRWDFYVVNDLPVDILLSNEFIFKFDLFSEFEHFIVDHECSPELPGFYNVRLISKYSPELARLEEESNNDLRSPNAVEAERVRRDRIRDTIYALDDPAKQSEAQCKEQQRQHQWDSRRKEHERQQKLATVNAGQAVTQGDGQQLPKPKKRWWESHFLQRES